MEGKQEMNDYRKGAHTLFDCKYHLVWVTKYRYQVLRDAVGFRVREIAREVCARHNVQILKGHVSTDHVHMHVSIPPNIAVSKFIRNFSVATVWSALDRGTRER